MLQSADEVPFPTSGTIKFNGVDITGERPAQIARRGVIRSFQISAVFPHLTVLENVRIGLQRKTGLSFHFWRSDRQLASLNAPARELLEQVDLGAFADETTVNLPYGRKRALEIATTLAMEPELMLLDEPTQGMGHEDVDRVTQLIKRVSAGRTILMVEHNMNVVSSIADTITVLARGSVLAEGSYAEVSPPRRDAGLHGHHRRRIARSTCMSTPALEISGLQAWYGNRISCTAWICAGQGEVVTLLGRNGAGRTTTLRAILGLTGSRKGSVRIHGTEAIDLPTYKIAHLGVGYCPEERGIFASLSCEENLLLPPVVGSLGGGMSLTEIYDMFPNLLERRHSRAPACRAANNRCWRWRASCAPAPTCCCWTRSPKAWRRSSCRPWPA